MVRWLQALLITVVALGSPLAPASAQFRDQIQSPILTIDSERLYRESAFGQKAESDIEALGQALAQENERIANELEAEELALTEQRPNLSKEEFRELADAFDQRVQLIRREQDAKARDLNKQFEQARRDFLNRAAPVLETMMREAGAAVILEQRSVFLSATAIDITDAALARVNASIGDGAAD